MVNHERIPIAEHPLALGSFRNWLRLLLSNHRIEARYLPRALFVTLTTLVTSPLRLIESAVYGRAVRNTAIQHPPIFILGHWRTGTTHLHNLLCRDPQWGFVSTFQGLAPGLCLIGRGSLDKLLAYWMKQNHPTRIIDNIPLRIDAPQEEEFALANTTPYAFIHVYSFPQQALELFARTTLFQGISKKGLAEWSKRYIEILQKATLREGGKRLILKNPANTGRIRELLRLFPDAKFIHLCRNPYDLFMSTRYQWRVVLVESQLQTISPGEVDQLILQFYAQLMQQFLTDRVLIPANNLIEVRFEELEAEPLSIAYRIYEALELPGFTEAEPAFQRYLASVANYKKNQYTLTADIVNMVNTHWSFAFDAWGYQRIESLPNLSDLDVERSDGKAPTAPERESVAVSAVHVH